MDLGFRLLAAKHIRRQAKQLASQLEGLRAAEDIEYVHRARVATRRLRAGLKLFDDCFGRKQVRHWSSAVRRVTSQLGSARDRDVQIEYLCIVLASLQARECFPGISRILVQLERNRERLQRKVVKAVDRLEASGTLDEMQRVTKKSLRKSESWAESVRTPTAFFRTQQQILRRVDALLRHQENLANPDDRESHHAMRIAAKRLRYVLEIAKPVYPGKLDIYLEGVKKVQTLLGDVHDSDVWIEDLDEFAAKERRRLVASFGHAGRLARLQPGIDYLRNERQQHRQEVFGQLVEYWNSLAEERFWQELADVLMTHQAATIGPITTPSTLEEGPFIASQEASSSPLTTETEQSENGSNGHLASPHKPLLTAGS